MTSTGIISNFWQGEATYACFFILPYNKNLSYFHKTLGLRLNLRYQEVVAEAF